VTALSDQPHTGAADALGNAAKQISQSCALASTYSLAITHRCLPSKRQPLAAYRFGGLECMLLGPGEGGLMSMIG